jgi:hypothetical protein
MFNAINSNRAGFFAHPGSLPRKASTSRHFLTFNNDMPHTVLHKDALITAGMRLPGGGWFNASVFKAESFTPENPIMLVKGFNTDGKPFMVEINANEVNPRNASFVEMFALDGYLASKGQYVGATRAAASAMIAMGAEYVDGFTKIDFVSSLKEAMAIFRQNQNWELFSHNQHVLDVLTRVSDNFR